MSKKPTPEQVFKRLYDGGVQLRMGEDGRLKAAHASVDGCTEAEKQMIRAYAKQLRALLDDSATADYFGKTFAFVNDQLQGRPERLYTPAINKLFDEADDAYQAGDTGRARWLLLCAASDVREAVKRHERELSEGVEQEVLA